jgi:hypothetical protein
MFWPDLPYRDETVAGSAQPTASFHPSVIFAFRDRPKLSTGVGSSGI